MIITTPISTPRLRLRSLTEVDASDAYLAWMNDTQTNQYLESRFQKLERPDLVRFIVSCNEAANSLLLAITLCADDRHIGNIKLGPIDSHHRFADIGLVIGDRREWGKGYAREAIAAVADYAFGRLQMHKLTAGCYASNVGSRKAFEACGFGVEGVRRAQYRSGDRWEDAFLLGRLAP